MNNDLAKLVVKDKPVHVLHGDPAVCAPSDFAIYDLRPLAEVPPRRAETVALSTLECFTEYVGRRNVPEKTCVFVSDRQIKAVFDYCAGDDQAAWQTDVAIFPMFYSTEWDSWRENNRKYMPQRKFLEFLEDNLASIVEPSGTEFYAMAEQFRAAKSVEYMSGYRTSNGETRLVYNETLRGAQRELAIPESITLQVPIIQGAEEATTYNVRARIKFNIDSDTHKLGLCYELVRPDIPERNTVKDIVSHLKGLGIVAYAGELKKSNYESFGAFAEKAYRDFK